MSINITVTVDMELLMRTSTRLQSTLFSYLGNFLLSQGTLLNAMTQISDWLVVLCQWMKRLVQWRSVLVGSGAQCVITLGIIQMQLLSVNNLVSVQKVRRLLCHLYTCK